mmetsp:Transcript_38897/g.111759  ORF Transcript_38897/g.111759 Transcript_38897/m.111759 type:complete len:230 (+) Transcript_38897:83-772(+)
MASSYRTDGPMRQAQSPMKNALGLESQLSIVLSLRSPKSSVQADASNSAMPTNSLGGTDMRSMIRNCDTMTLKVDTNPLDVVVLSSLACASGCCTISKQLRIMMFNISMRVPKARTTDLACNACRRSVPIISRCLFTAFPIGLSSLSAAAAVQAAITTFFNSASRRGAALGCACETAVCAGDCSFEIAIVCSKARTFRSASPRSTSSNFACSACWRWHACLWRACSAAI